MADRKSLDRGSSRGRAGQRNRSGGVVTIARARCDERDPSIPLSPQQGSRATISPPVRCEHVSMTRRGRQLMNATTEVGRQPTSMKRADSPRSPDRLRNVRRFGESPVTAACWAGRASASASVSLPGSVETNHIDVGESWSRITWREAPAFATRFSEEIPRSRR